MLRLLLPLVVVALSFQALWPSAIVNATMRIIELCCSGFQPVLLGTGGTIFFGSATSLSVNSHVVALRQTRGFATHFLGSWLELNVTSLALFIAVPGLKLSALRRSGRVWSLEGVVRPSLP